MFGRQTSGSVVCVSCGYLVGVADDRCYHCGRRNPGLWGFAPVIRHLGHDLGFVPFMTGVCVVVFALTLLFSRGNIGLGGGLFNLLAPDTVSQVQFGASGACPVFYMGRWWTLLSASWLHGSLLHILFNVLWIRQLAPEVGELYGPGRMVIVYTVAGVAGFAASSAAGHFLFFLPPLLSGARITVGASASIFGLLGALVCYGRRTGSSAVHSQALYWAVMMFIFGVVMNGVDNYAHAGGFAGGWLAARLLDPLKPERINHLALALVCLGLSVLAIVVSFLVPLFVPAGPCL
jgi:rhomboid protease GluP